MILLFSDGVEDQLNARRRGLLAGAWLGAEEAGGRDPEAVADAFFADLDQFTNADHRRSDGGRDESPLMPYRDRALYWEDVALADIAAARGTPCYVYSRAGILEKFRAYDAAFGDTPHTVCYAVKANAIWRS